LLSRTAPPSPRPMCASLAFSAVPASCPTR
jgi:hypothetical protein